MPTLLRYGFLSIAEASAQLQRHPQFLYEQVAARRIAHHRVGGRIFITQGDLDSFIAASRKPALRERKTKK
jgi:excisionase family DNA binding protein